MIYLFWENKKSLYHWKNRQKAENNEKNYKNWIMGLEKNIKSGKFEKRNKKDTLFTWGIHELRLDIYRIDWRGVSELCLEVSIYQVVRLSINSIYEYI